MPRRPVSVGLIQETASDDRAANLERTIVRIREAAERGAQIICLQELFNAPYFCKSLDSSTASTSPSRSRARRPSGCSALAQELDVVLVVPFYERQAAGLYRNSAAVIDADGTLLGTYRKMHIPHDPLFEEKYYFAPGRRARADAAHGARTRGEQTASACGSTRYADIGVLICWDQWYPEGARITSLLGADILFYPTAIGWHPAEKAEFGRRRRWTRGAPCSARTRSPTASSSPSPNRVGLRGRSRAPTASSSSASRSSPIPSAAAWPRRARTRPC